MKVRLHSNGDASRLAALLLPQIFPIIPDILGRHALPAGRLAVLGATPDFHHGLPAPPGSPSTYSAGIGNAVMRGDAWIVV
jgi:hypothetical protein